MKRTNWNEIKAENNALYVMLSERATNTEHPTHGVCLPANQLNGNARTLEKHHLFIIRVGRKPRVRERSEVKWIRKKRKEAKASESVYFPLSHTTQYGKLQWQQQQQHQRSVGLFNCSMHGITRVHVASEFPFEWREQKCATNSQPASQYHKISNLSRFIFIVAAAQPHVILSVFCVRQIRHRSMATATMKWMEMAMQMKRENFQKKKKTKSKLIELTLIARLPSS